MLNSFQTSQVIFIGFKNSFNWNAKYMYIRNQFTFWRFEMKILKMLYIWKFLSGYNFGWVCNLQEIAKNTAKKKKRHYYQLLLKGICIYYWKSDWCFTFYKISQHEQFMIHGNIKNNDSKSGFIFKLTSGHFACISAKEAATFTLVRFLLDVHHLLTWLLVWLPVPCWYGCW